MWLGRHLEIIKDSTLNVISFNVNNSNTQRFVFQKKENPIPQGFKKDRPRNLWGEMIGKQILFQNNKNI